MDVGHGRPGSNPWVDGVNSAARRLHARKARNRLILTRVGQVLLTAALLSTLIVGDRIGAHYRAQNGVHHAAT